MDGKAIACSCFRSPQHPLVPSSIWGGITPKGAKSRGCLHPTHAPQGIIQQQDLAMGMWWQEEGDSTEVTVLGEAGPILQDYQPQEKAF